MTPRLAIAAAVAALVAMPAQAITLNFDDLSPGEAFASYAGFSFTNFYALDARTFVPSGYANGVISRENVAYNGNGYSAVIASATAFSLTSADLTAAWNDGLTVNVIGSLKGAIAYTQNFILDTTGPLLAVFNHAAVDRVQIVSFGGVHHDGYDSGYGTQLAIDDLTLDRVGGVHSDTTIPEPASWALLTVGFALVGAGLRRPLAATRLA
ncbi:MAG: PEPxxWA-CTERM sorting domain-containing protein [Sphingomonadaceae bacterium]|nr:PEPxxWA-CTERM sorting domain-containing protein [Sphingomonadaceae bacterium]